MKAAPKLSKQARAWGSIMAAALACPAWAQWSLDVDAGLRHDDNLGNAREAQDRVSDYVRTLSLSAQDFAPRENGSSFAWGGRIEGESFSHVQGLNNVSLGAFASFRHKFGLGPYAPWLRLAWSSAHLNFQNDARNGWLHRAEAGLGKRFDERWDLSAALRLERRTAHTQPEETPGISGDIFSQRSKTLAVQAAYAPTSQLRLTLAGLARRGDVVSTVLSEETPPPAVKAIADDKAFGGEAYAYRLTGTTYGGSVGIGLLLGPRSSLKFQLQRLVTAGPGGYTYTKTVHTLDWIGTF